MQQQRLKSITYLSLSAFILLLALVVSGTTTNAATAKNSNSKTTSTAKAEDKEGRITQSYNADPAVQMGMIVALKEKGSATVIPLSYDKSDSALGVVVPTNSAAIVLTPEKSTVKQVLVSNTGRYQVLVSTQHGPVKIGDYLSISAISGVAMKAGQDQKEVVGKATGNFSGTSNVISSLKLKDSSGKDVSVAIGRVELDINLGKNPLFQQTLDQAPGFLADAAATIASKPVSVARIYLGVVIIFLVSLITGSVLYSGVRSGMIAVGRNPLSKKSIIRSLIETVLAAIIIFITGVFAVYLLLKL